MRLPHCGPPEQGFLDGLELLKQAKLGAAQPLAGPVLVIGGGNVAMDVAKTALRLGASEVRVIFLEARETMPAHTWECDEALAEGVMLVPASATVSFEVHEGRVVSALCKRVQRIEVDDKKRIRPVLWDGTEFALPAATVLTAVGSSPDYGIFPNPAVAHPALGRGRSWVASRHPRGWRSRCSMVGDYLSGPASVIQAIAAGYQAAEGLTRALGKVRYARLPHWNRMRRVRFTGYADTPRLRRRNQMAMEEPAERCTSFCEICHVYPEQDAQSEAARCLRCRWDIAPAPKQPRTPQIRVPSASGAPPPRRT